MDPIADGDTTHSLSGATWPRHMVPRSLSGRVGEDVDEWLKHFNRVSKYNCWDASSRLSNVGLFLQGTALVWFENHEETITTWEAFETEIASCCGDPLMKKRAEQTLMQRAQVPGETCTTYIEEILKSCKSIDSRMKEDDKVGHLLKGVAEDVYNFLIDKDTLASVADVIQHCRTFETLIARRITPKFDRLTNVTTVASVDVPPISSCDLASMIREIIREELGRRDAINPPRAPTNNTSPPYDAMCAAVDATLYDVPQSRAPEPPTDNLHHRRGFQNASRQPPTMVSSWDDHGHMAPRGKYGDVREAPVCYNCGFRGHVARFCGQRRRPQQRYYEGSSASSRQNRWRGGMRSMRNAYVRDGFHQMTRSDTHVGRDFHRNLRNDSPSSVRSLTPPTTRRFRSPSPGRRVTSPPPGN
ncbi:uncharacterized protein LOC119166784 [Rhipicephalus microplus]|uniref:uncharacterized protein LOC119166784 n=1 Tax=Rhipicephalus microplus TaxID=6941 RepID=UPI003F6CD803